MRREVEVDVAARWTELATELREVRRRKERAVGGEERVTLALAEADLLYQLDDLRRSVEQ